MARVDSRWESLALTVSFGLCLVALFAGIRISIDGGPGISVGLPRLVVILAWLRC